MKHAFALTLCSATLCLAAGCSKPDAKKPAPGPAPAAQGTTASATPKQDHHHGDAPHGGTLTDWGGGAYHVEFAVDHDKQEATVYILGGDAKTPAPIKAESITLTINDPMTEMELKADPLEGETGGKSSRFVGTHKTIGIVKEFAGTISGEVEGTPYTGDFKEEPHGADGHTH